MGSDDLLVTLHILLNNKLSNTTFGQIIKSYRDKMLTHPNFLMSSIKKHIHKKYDILDPEKQLIFSGLVNDLFYQTQVLCLKIIERFPEALSSEEIS